MTYVAPKQRDAPKRTSGAFGRETGAINTDPPFLRFEASKEDVPYLKLLHKLCRECHRCATRLIAIHVFRAHRLREGGELRTDTAQLGL